MKDKIMSRVGLCALSYLAGSAAGETWPVIRQSVFATFGVAAVITGVLLALWIFAERGVIGVDR